MTYYGHPNLGFTFDINTITEYFCIQFSKYVIFYEIFHNMEVPRHFVFQDNITGGEGDSQ